MSAGVATAYPDLLALILAEACSWRHVDHDFVLQPKESYADDSHWERVLLAVAGSTRAPVEHLQICLATALSGGAKPTEADLTWPRVVLALRHLVAGLDLHAEPTGASGGSSAHAWQTAAQVVGREFLLALRDGGDTEQLREGARPLAAAAGSWNAHIHAAPAACLDIEQAWQGRMEKIAFRNNTLDVNGAPARNIAKANRLEQEAAQLRARMLPAETSDRSEEGFLRNQIVEHLELSTTRCQVVCSVVPCQQCIDCATYLRIRSEWLQMMRACDRLSGLLEFTWKFGQLRSIAEQNDTASWKTSSDLRHAKLEKGLPSGRASRWFFTPNREKLGADTGGERALGCQARRALKSAKRIEKQTEKAFGVDVASAEIGWHPETWRPFYEAAADAGIRSLAMHVGEDMADVLTGIRLVSDGSQMLKELATGKTKPRLGHALAIRVDVASWYAKQGVARPIAWEHALDLIWAADMFANQSESQKVLEHRWKVLRVHLGGCAKSLRLLDAVDAYRANRSFCDHAVAQDGRVPDGVPPRLVRPGCLGSANGAGANVHSFSFVPTPGWIKLVTKAQRAVRRFVAKNAIVEVCPSSNAAISGLGWSFGLDMGLGGPLKPALKVRIGTDDPGLLATSLPLERAMLRSWFLRCGEPPDRVDAFLRKAFSRLK